MNYPTPGREAFEAAMKAQFPDGQPRSGSVITRKPISKELQEAIEAMREERARAKAEAENDDETEVANAEG